MGPERARAAVAHWHKHMANGCLLQNVEEEKDHDFSDHFFFPTKQKNLPERRADVPDLQECLVSTPVSKIFERPFLAV